MGYKIREIYELWIYEKESTIILKDYINHFMERKIQASGGKSLPWGSKMAL